MKKLFFTVVALLVVAVSCNKNGDIAPVKLEATLTTQTGTPIGAAVTTNITASGGTASLPAIGIKVIVPAGAMATGSQLVIQQVSNVIEPESKAMSINGDWTKPITIEYQSPDDEPTTHNLFLGMPNGLWIGAAKPKINGKTISIRLDANAGAALKNARVMAKKYDLAFAKVFSLKPASVKLELGKTQQFTAYAKQGFVPKKKSDGTYITDDKAWDKYVNDMNEDVVPFASSKPTTVAYDEDIVPLAPYKNTSYDEEIVPLAVHAKEVPFSNSKEGFTRGWKVTNGVGTISSTGLFSTAATDFAAKGQTAVITFTSTNNSTKSTIIAGGLALIDDGLERYVGTFRLESFKVQTSDGNFKEKRTWKRVTEGKLYFVFDADQSKGRRFRLDKSKPNIAKLIEYQFVYDSKRVNGPELINSETNLSSESLANFFTDSSTGILDLNSDGTYVIQVFLVNSGNAIEINNRKEVFSNGKTENTTNSSKCVEQIEFYTGYNYNDGKIKIDDVKSLKGERNFTLISTFPAPNTYNETGRADYIAKWNFVKE